MKDNAGNKTKRLPPLSGSQLCEFLRESPAISNVD